MEGIGSADAVAAHPDRPRVLAALEGECRGAGRRGRRRPVDELRLPRALPERARGAVAGAGRDLGAAADQDSSTGRKVGVITASARNLTPAHFEAVDAPPDTPVEGLPAGQLVRRDLPAQRPDARSRRRRARGDRGRPGAAGQASRRRHHRARMHQPAALQDGAEARARACRCSTCSTC